MSELHFFVKPMRHPVREDILLTGILSVRETTSMWISVSYNCACSEF